MAGRERITFNLVDVVAAGLARSNGGLDLLDLVDVNDLVKPFADSEHGSLKNARAVPMRRGRPGLRG